MNDDTPDEPPVDLSTHPIHLGLGATAVVEPTFTGELGWYQGYGERHGTDGAEGRLVAEHRFDQDWDSWEMHPHGSEVVLVLDGRVRLHQDRDGNTSAVELGPGQYAINEPGVWHTADAVAGPARVLFITAGAGTQHRPR